MVMEVITIIMLHIEFIVFLHFHFSYSSPIGAYGEKYGDMIDTPKNGLSGGYGPLSIGGLPHIRRIKYNIENKFKTGNDMLK